ncbi:uncharacterized protein [Nicotiana sylvestris]|uniref:uncharacterized protein n=1 Tax=Nicotiana sylvestris TaxID=4096 RepID=UPI00388C4498
MVPRDEDISRHVVEIGPDGQFHEAPVCQIGSECQYLMANTRVLDLSRGEVAQGYLAWYKREVEFGRPAKRLHLQEFVGASQEQWDWLAKENEYRATIGRLEKQVMDLQFENGLKAATDEGFPIYHHYQSTTFQTPQAPPPKPVLYPPPPATPIFVAPPPATIHLSSSEPLFQAHDNQYYPHEPTFKAPEPYSYTPRFDLPVEAEKPSKNLEQEEMFRKVKSLEKSFRDMRGLGGQVSVTYKDLCLFSDVQLPTGFKMPKFDLYDGQGDPIAHLIGFYSKMRGAGGKDELLMAYFSQSLSGSALEWYTRQDHGRCESFSEYGFHWREQAARVDPPMKESEMVDYFLQALEPTYFSHMVSAVGKSFNEVVKMGGMVEEGLKSNKIMSYSAIKATTQAIQGGARGIIGKKKREDVATIDSGAWLKQLDMLRSIQSKLPNPPPKNLDYSVSCEYCSGTLGHDIEKCWHLKSVIQELIDTNRIEVQALEAPNINQNPMPTRQKTNMIEIMHKGGEPRKPSQTVMMIQSSEVKTIEPSMAVKKRAIPWNYERVIVTYKGKEVKEEVCETQIANKIFEVNKVTFSDEELPVEGTEHNRTLYLMVKCEDSVVTRVLVDNGSSANICPLSTLSKLKVEDERIHKNNIYVRGFDGGGKDSVGDIVLELTIGLVEFTMEFQDRQEIVVHSEDNLFSHSNAVVPFIEMEDDKGSWVYQGIIQPVSLPKNLGTFGMGFKPTAADIKRVRKLKQRARVLSKPVPRLSRSFVKSGTRSRPVTTIPNSVFDPDKELIENFEKLFDDVNMVEIGKGFSFYAGSNGMVCMRNPQLSLKHQSDFETIIQEVECDDESEYDEDEAFEEISKELNHFKGKPKPNLNDTETINLGDADNIREIKISIHLETKIREEIIKSLIEYKDIFAWSYDDMPGYHQILMDKKDAEKTTFITP